MNHFRILFATAGVGAYFYKSVANNASKIFKVNAQPHDSQQPCGDEFDFAYTSTFMQSDVNQSSNMSQLQGPLTSTPIKKRCWDQTNTSLTKKKITPPTLSCLKGTTFYVCSNAKHEMPNWTLEHIPKNKFKHDPHGTLENFLDQCKAELTFQVGDVPNFESYCCRDIDPCFYQALPPQENHVHFPCTSAWQDFFDYVKVLSENHEHMYICSGPILRRNALSGEEYTSFFYKAILIKRRDKTYQMQCFIFPMEPKICQNTKLENYQSYRLQLEYMLGYQLFQDLEHPEDAGETSMCQGCCFMF